MQPDAIDPAAWRVLGASVRGSRHCLFDQPCQDAHGWTELPDGTLIISLADGAGSASCADLGARLAVDGALRAARQRLAAAIPTNDTCWKSLLLEIADAARQDVELRAAADQISPRELACTLIVAVAAATSIAVVQIGDGGAVFGTEDTVGTLTAPMLGEYVNETTFLISPEALETAQVHVRMTPIDRIAVITDGLQMLALDMPSGAPFPPFFNPLFDFAANTTDAGKADAALAAWMASPKVTARTDDDTTLLLAVRVA